MKIGIGIDTGGTYTDAVIYDFDQKKVLAKGKSLTTKENLEMGIVNAMDSLPDDLLHQASILSLSTTLATNACVENKGGRAKLILLGTTRKVMEWIDAKTRYGLQTEDVLCIETENGYEKDVSDSSEWFHLLQEHDEWLADAQALAVAEVKAMNNGAACEKLTKQKLTEKYHVPFVMGNELACGLNVMERGATALLNARLLPIIEEFMSAVSSALKKRHLNVSEMIVRSDGSLMSDSNAVAYPVQTILSGPAASVIGAMNLADAKDCLIIDMGGTTTDISLVRSGIPAMSNRISIGGYRTQIQGVYIDTFGLGGDSRIVICNEKPALDSRRVQPLCVAASEYPQIITDLQQLIDTGRRHSMPLHEFLYLVKEPKNPKDYSGIEISLIEKLRKQPLMLGSNELDIYNLKTERLEREGIIMRCGLTPTDIMHIRGDFSKYGKTASELGARYLMQNLPGYEDADLFRFCEDIYQLVYRKLYENILKIMIVSEYPDIFQDGPDTQIMEMIRRSWDREEKHDFLSYSFHSKASLIGIGAPTHIFLPKVAEKLGVPYIIPPHAEVANAVGTITAGISVQCEIRISPNYTDDGVEGYAVFAPDGKHVFETKEEAIKDAKAAAGQQIAVDARKRGAMCELQTEYSVRSQNGCDKNGAAIELDTFVTATARGKIYS